MRARQISVLTCVTVCLLAVGVVASGQTARGGAAQPKAPTSASQPATALPVSEQPFIAQAAMANMAEIQLGHLAVKTSQSQAVKKFAAQIVDDHIKAQNALADAARGEGIQWPKGLDDKHAAIQRQLSTLKGVEFDRLYLKAMIDGHRDVEKALAARAGDTGRATSELAANVTEWSVNTLPVVRAHLKKADEVSAELEQRQSQRGSN